MDKYFNVYCGSEIVNKELLTEEEADKLVAELLMNGHKNVLTVDVRTEE